MEIPYDIGNIPGPKMARAVTVDEFVRRFKKSKRPLLVVGSEVSDRELRKRVEKLIDMGIPTVATGGSIRYFVEDGYAQKVKVSLLHELTNMLLDESWMGFDGKGNYDFVMFLGITYYLASQMLSALKNFAPHLSTASIDRYYHPNADISFKNQFKDEKFFEMLDEIIEKIGEDKNE
ncbi:MAG: anaerobic carbon-monoxide dehydrogenase, complex subunit epsilon [Archaeoglobi archaeon]|nr:CO dehydrogenase/acetyl-CoA synthase complex subunit epsilon [Candidatus Mnemosynella bozhongmuii]MDI3502174.1 anaerobic carbon-monoxide dehydrogenase, complex subunit epsilon [Archaeoglobi archaeon]MDK2781328.1 anaerobic carbon-monoxide dehydrogenase, complex subunit epsilon [Archaeoglobi archaeon]